MERHTFTVVTIMKGVVEIIEPLTVIHLLYIGRGINQDMCCLSYRNATTKYALENCKNINTSISTGLPLLQ